MARRTLIARTTWTSEPNPWPRMLRAAVKAFVHHTVMRMAGGARASRKVEQAYWRTVRAVGIARGFRDVSYSVGICLSGRSYVLAGHRIAAHTCNHNGDGLGFVAAGDFHNPGADRATGKLLRGIGRAIRAAKRRGWVSKAARLLLHRDVGACTGGTACPGNRLAAKRGRIRKLARLKG